MFIYFSEKKKKQIYSYKVAGVETDSFNYLFCVSLDK